MNKTAIILFAHLPDFEARAKSFSANSSVKATKQISQLLTQHFLKLASQTTADVFFINSLQQKGNSFGERIANAFEDMYARGYHNVVCIGNDTPDLSLNDLQSAIYLVEKGKVVLGPAADGGAYLIAIPKQKFKAEEFSNIKWQCCLTYRELKTAFNNQIEEFNLLADLDDAEQILNFSKSNKLILIIRDIIFSFKQKLKIYFGIFHSIFYRIDSSSLTSPPFCF